jgi:predicted ATPase/class 3 adenylate cyclase/Tfp pilus assembly protein PilF
MPDRLTGRVTFFFTDIEGSTHLLQHLGDDRYAQILAEQRRIMRAAFEAWRGHEFHTEGDAFLVAFRTAADAAGAATEALRALAAHPWPEGAPVRVRVGLHTGAAALAGGGYIGLDVHRTNRVMSAGYGGQVLLSQATYDDLADDLPDGVTIRDLGDHRLKDLTHPERLFQLVIPGLPADFPPPKTLDVVSNNLPVLQTSFIGRERELEEVKQLLGRNRLVTLMGAGGAGKTRLSIQVAADLIEQFKHGAWQVELAPLTDPGLVVPTIASTLGVREVAGRAILDSLIDYLQPKTLLLVMDNCEHLVESAAQTIGALLRVCPTLRVLATSRDALGVAGEATYRIPPLARPDARRRYSLEELAEFAAVRLFVERAVQSNQQFALTEDVATPVARITQRLDGIPLAIELAAAQMNALSAAEIDTRLSDRFQVLTGGQGGLPHHQTLRATIDWSYDLLGEVQRLLFRRLAVFAGGFILDAAEEICAGDRVDGADVLDLLTTLVDKSLVMAEEVGGEVRYRVLETIREYGRDKLQESAEEAAAAHGKHLRWYFRLVEQAEPELRRPAQLSWLDRLETEHDNLRAALEWSKNEDHGTGVRVAGALHHFWLLRGHLTEGRDWLEAAITADTDGSGPAFAKAVQALGALELRLGRYDRANTLCERSLALFQAADDNLGMGLSLNVLGTVARIRGDYQRAREMLEEALVRCRQAHDMVAVAQTLNTIGVAARRQHDYDRARAALEESVTLWREHGDRWGLAHALGTLGVVIRQQGDYALATALHEESLALRREMGDRLEVASSLQSLGAIAIEQEDYAKAAGLLEEAVALFRDLGDMLSVAAALGNLGFVAFHRGDFARATELLDESLRLARELGSGPLIAGSLCFMGMVAHAGGDHARAAALLQQSVTLFGKQADKIWLAVGLVGLASVAAAQGKPQRGARLLGAADALRDTVGTPLSPMDRTDREHALAAVCALLEEEAFSAAWAEGQALTVDQAIVEASQSA